MAAFSWDIPSNQRIILCVLSVLSTTNILSSLVLLCTFVIGIPMATLAARTDKLAYLTAKNKNGMYVCVCLGRSQILNLPTLSLGKAAHWRPSVPWSNSGSLDHRKHF